jgi:hypothetical protein
LISALRFFFFTVLPREDVFAEVDVRVLFRAVVLFLVLVAKGFSVVKKL